MPETHYRYRDVSFIFPLIGVLLLAYGIYAYYWKESHNLPYFIFISIFLLIIAPFSIDIIDADRLTKTLTITTIRLLRYKKTTFPFDEIATIAARGEWIEDVDDEDGTTNSSLQFYIEATLKDGSSVPLTSQSRRLRKKGTAAEALREFIGVSDTIPATQTEMVSQIAQTHYQTEQELISGDQDEVHETDGVRWQIETTVFGGSPVTRWHSQDFSLPNQFLYLGQKIEGQKKSGRLARLLIDKTVAFSFTIYGFKTAATPDEDDAKLLEVGNELEPHFVAFGNNNNLSATLLNSHTTFALRKWAEQHPLKKIVKKGSYNQLVVLYCPQGLYLATLETLSQERINELASLGVALVQAQQ